MEADPTMNSLRLTKALIHTGIAPWLPSVRRRLGGGGAIPSLPLRPVPRHAAGRVAGDCKLPAPGNRRGTQRRHHRFGRDRPPARISPPPAARDPRTANCYPPPSGLPELRTAVADHLARGRLSVNPADEVLITAGATAAFGVALDTFVNPGDRISVFAPTSPLFRVGLMHRRARIQWVPTSTEAGRLRFHMEPFTKALARSKMLVLSHPANPTGGVIAPEDLEQIAWWANKFDALIYCDESFARFRTTNT